MTEKIEGLAYDNMAWFYNQYWGGRFIDKLFPFMERVVLGRIPENATILDLCCGTGQLAHHLTERGYKVFGVDNAAAMLEYARINAPNAQFIHSDAQTFEVPEPVDAVFSTFDSLNHVKTIDELTTVFRAVNRALRPDGLFLFDLNMEDAFIQKWKGSWTIEKPDHKLSARSDYSPKTKTGKLAVKMARLMDGRWHRSEATFVEHCFERDEVMQALTGAGFTISECGSATDFGINDNGRLMILARKTTPAELA